MILDTLDSVNKYYDLYPGMKEALEFLIEAVNTKKTNGKYEINGSKIYSSISNEKGKGRGNNRLETHQKYIDIQFCLEGEDFIGWKPAMDLLDISEEYDLSKDVAFFSDKPREWFTVSGNIFCVFFPEDAHAPLSGDESLRKIVIKIAVQ